MRRLLVSMVMLISTSAWAQQSEPGCQIANALFGALFVEFHPELTPGGADNNLDYLEVVHVFVRRSNSSCQALYQAG